jgi:hypothetical protein
VVEVVDTERGEDMTVTKGPSVSKVYMSILLILTR